MTKKRNSMLDSKTKLRASVILILTVLGIGTLGYSLIEGWSYPVLFGDATKDQTLEDAGIERAGDILVVLGKEDNLSLLEQKAGMGARSV